MRKEYPGLVTAIVIVFAGLVLYFGAIAGLLYAAVRIVRFAWGV